MQINTDFWGDPSTWSTTTGAELAAEIKGINWNSPNLQTYWSGGYSATGDNNYVWSAPPKPEVTPIAWGIGKDSALAQPQYMFMGYSNPVNGSPFVDANVTEYTRDLRLDKKTLDFCPQRQSYGVSEGFGWRNRVYPSANAISNVNCQCGGILTFNYQNIVLYPMLKIARRVEHSNSYRYGLQEYSQYVTIDEFFTGGTTRFPNPAKNDYPLILAVVINSWYLGGQPVYSGGQYVSGARSSIVNNNISMRFNEPCKGKDYYKSVSYKYNNIVQQKTPEISDDYYTMYPAVMWNSNLSGYYYNRLGYEYTLIGYTEADDEEKAWTLPKNSSASNINYPVILQNGKYNIEAIQAYDGTNYYNTGIVIAIWDTTQTETTKDDILKDVAYLGFWFSEDATTAQRALTGAGCVDDKMHIPIFDSKGVTTGEWKSGTAAAQESNATWGDPFEDSPYIPSSGGDDNDFGNLNNSVYRGINFYNLKMYALTETQLLTFLSTVNAMYTGDNDTLQMDLDFKGSNPNDYIIGLYGYPFDIPNLTSLVTINLGPVDTGVQCRSVADNFYGELSFGSMYIAPYYNDFRDYEPYTSIELYVPLCGTVKLDPALYIGHTINLYYVFDPSTGNLSAKICRDNIVDKILDGAICVQIPITSANMGDYQRSIHQIKTQILKTAIDAGRSMLPNSSFAMSAMSDNIGGMVASAPKNPISVGIDVGLKAGEIRYELTHTQPHISTTGTADPLNALNMDNHAFVFIKRAKMLAGYDAETYSHTVGNACLIQSKIGDMSGFIKCSNVDLSGIPATADEINAIQTALQNGIYV